MLLLLRATPHNPKAPTIFTSTALASRVAKECLPPSDA
jgi:hypothetical protein